MEKKGVITNLIIYPIKSCAGIKVDKALVTKYGLAYFENPNVIDRKWMIIDENNNFITQRKAPKMALIKPRVENDYLILSAPDMSDLRVPIEIGDKTRIKNCRCWSSHIDGYSYGNQISDWLSKYFEMPNVDLVVFDITFKMRKVLREESKPFNTRPNDEVIYADYSPLMILSEASIEDINSKLSKKVTVRNFRPNILVKECEAYEEDKWTDFMINDIKLRTIKHCTRCLLTTVDPDIGVKSDDQEPLKTLKEYRTNKEIYGVSPMFGINVAIDQTGETSKISIGDTIIAN